ncbi:AAA family ATPase [Candidatus Daviesbacteria bacterium]|nr:AAA family ATPase [Candidatus Daviesbacteria bacterium]
MDPAQLIEKLKSKIQSSKLPSDVVDRLNNSLARVEIILKTSGYSLEADREVSFINFVCELPWEKVGQDILDINRAKQVLDKNHFGMENIKERILEHIAILILNHQKGTTPNIPILAFVGLPGSGKTTLAYSIAESMGKPLVRIPFGGLGSALQLRGESRVKPEAEPGLIIKALKKTGVKNPLILLDELDRVTTEARADIMGVLVELLDPEQNKHFLDHYLDIPFDLSQVLFVTTANNVSNVATAVLDRLEVIEMPFYSDEQKIVIGKDYLLPQALKNATLDPKVVNIDTNLWSQIVRPLGYDGGIRSLRRNIETLVRRVAKRVVSGEAGPFNITNQNVNDFLNT